MESVLVANRGEIARRVIRTARRLGIRTIAVYSSADAQAPFVFEADQAIAIGPAAARDSYLNMENILAAARSAGAAAIHPGYGFLSENASFAEAVSAAGLVWVGAPPASIRAMGLKDAAKALMIQAGVPVTPGYLGADQSPASLEREAARIGFPILIKAVAGGGGKGMRRVDAASQFAEMLNSCRREAVAAFGDERVLLEKYVQAPRHIEVQVFGDTHGNIVHLFERDCSLQRRHQKVIEEAPAPGMDTRTREFICSIAVRAAQAVNYVGAGTIEFIADASAGLNANAIWFMEMNTRLQVEHPVTEAITGQDLVEWQLKVASGERLPLLQGDLQIRGWAIEARLYAENPATGFLPSTGTLQRLRLPNDIRVDSGVEEGGEVTGFYDPMIAKLIAHDATRTAAARRLSQACRAVQVWPVTTNAAFLGRLAAAPDFLEGKIDTGFIAAHTEALIPAAEPPQSVVDAAARALSAPSGQDPWAALTGFRSAAPAYGKVQVEIGGRFYSADRSSPESAARTPALAVDGTYGGERVLFVDGAAWRFGAPSAAHIVTSAAVADGALRSPMPGRIVSVAVQADQRVEKGQTILALEAMKMEHAMTAPFDGVVAEISVVQGDQVAENVVLARIERSAVNASTGH